MSNDEMGWEDSIGDIVSPGDVIAGKYRVDRLIGTGGMGIVVQAFHLHFEERVAIKFLVPQLATAESLTRFEREARAAFKIKSEHVARVIDVGKLEGDVPYMVMEFLEGTDLGVMLTDRRAFAIHDAVEFVLQALEAVAEAHVLGIVHRDLKPENLFLTKRTDGTPCIKVLDFGLSKATGDAKEQRQRALTGTAQVMGTPQYMSPEQWMSARDVGPATDQWALGVILYELVTGQQPFEQEQLAQLCTQVLRGEPEPVLKLRPDAPPGLVQIINRCLRKEPKQRFPNVGEMAVALLEYGPARVRTSVKRITGVFKKIGIDAGEVPPSVRGGGLGQNMVLGRAPASSQAPFSSPEPLPQPPPPPPPSQPHIGLPPPSVPRGSYPGLPRPAAPPPRGSYPSATPTSLTPSSGDLAATAVYHRDPGTFDHLPDPTGGEPPRFGPPAAIERAPSSSRTAVLDGQFPMPPPPPGQSGPWQRHPSEPPSAALGAMAPAMSPSGAQSVAAPDYSHLRPQGAGGTLVGPPPSASYAGYQDGAYPDAPHQRRAVTAQSWQHMLDPAAVARGNREKKVVFAVIAAVVMFATLVVVLLVSGGNGSTPAGEGVDDDDRTERRKKNDDTPNTRIDDLDEDPPASPSASASPSSSASTADTAPPRLSGPTSGAKGDSDSDSGDEPPAPKPKSSNPFKRERIFDRRN